MVQVQLCDRIRIWSSSLRSLTTLLYILSVFRISCPSYAAANSSNIGINYGQVADDLPPPSQVVGIIQSISISKAKIYSTNSSVLQAFANSGISFIVGVGNEDVADLTNAEKATDWIKENIANYLPSTQISGIAVGNEVYSGNDTQLMQNLLPAMKNLYSALASLGLNDVVVSTPHSQGILSSSYPPSGGVFVSSIASSYLMPLLVFLTQTGAPFWINAYPYFAYKANPTTVSLPYALFESTENVSDPNTGLVYSNMLDAQVDAIYYALQALGYSNTEVVVTETGWPSAGDPDEAGATIENAQAYNSNLMQRLASNKGTPRRPDVPLQAYIFALFNEDLKSGPTSERNYGLFKPDGTPAYDFGLVSPLASSTLYSISSSHKARPKAHLCWIGLLFPLVYFLATDVYSGFTVPVVGSRMASPSRSVTSSIF